MALAVGALAAVFASFFYNGGLLLQAEASRREPVTPALAAGLLVRLAQRRRWLAGSAVAILGWPLQTFALTRAPLTVVQPLLGVGLVIPLVFGKRMLGEPFRRSDLLRLVGLAAGVSLLVALAPPRTTGTAGSLRLAVALAILAAILVGAQVVAMLAARARVPLLILAAGVGFALSSITTKLLADAISKSDWAGAGAWLAATAAAGGLALLAEMKSLQLAVVSTVSAVVLALETVVPVTLSPFLFHEAAASGTLETALRALALALTIASAVALTRTRSVTEALSEP